jgi:DNA mismatch repair ATPase MutS
MLERWFLRPLTSIEDITKRHDAIELLSSHDNLGTTELIRRALKKASRTLLFVDRIKKGFGALHEWRMVTDVGGKMAPLITTEPHCSSTDQEPIAGDIELQETTGALSSSAEGMEKRQYSLMPSSTTASMTRFRSCCRRS